VTVQVVDQVRGPGLGASMAAACLGVSPYLSPIGAWLRLKGRTPDTAGPQAEWGNILEPVVRGYYAARHGLSVGDERSPDILVPTHSMYRADLPWLRATPDGIVREWVTPPSTWMPFDDGPDPSSPYWRHRHLVQVKTCDQRLRWHWGLNPRTPSVPPHYRIQAVVEMAVTGLDRCDFAVLCGGNDYFEVIVERDAELEASVLAGLASFWASLERDEPPTLDGADDWRVYFSDRLPKVKTEVIAPAHVETALDAWHEARAQAGAATAAIALLKNQIMAAAAEEQATAFESKHGRVLVIQPKNKPPYVKAPSDWGEETP